jgi:putative nucleotidyltransferase with HDIG domain
MPVATAQDRARHLEVILGRIDALPTLSPVAVRVLHLTTESTGDLSEITRLIESDPSLSAKILALTRRSDIGIARGVTSIERIVVLLGLDTLRAALLSAELYEMFKPESGHHDDEADGANNAHTFDASGFWRHSIAVACAAELIAEKFRAALPSVKPAEAYLCGLLHDLGKPALERALPKTYARVVAMAADGRASLADIEKRVMGVDHHTAGKRLGERWGLPHIIQDTMWLHAKALAAIPDVPHRATVALVGLANTFCRARHLGFSGNVSGFDRLGIMCEELGLDPARLEEIAQPLIARIAERCSALGLEEVTDRQMLLESLAQASKQLASVTARAERTAAAPTSSATGAARVTDFIDAFLASRRSRPGVGGAVECVAASVLSWLGGEAAALLWQNRPGSPWEGYEFAKQPANNWVALRQRQQFPDLPPTAPQTTWTLTDPDGTGTLVILHDRTESVPPLPTTLANVWRFAVQSAAQHEGASRLSEQLVDATDRLARAEEIATRSRVMSSLGEITAGAAHEMNNPLAVISGNAQLLAKSLKNPNDLRAAASIVKAASRLSDLIQSIHLFASPTPPTRAETDMNDLVARACRDARERCGMPNAHGSRGAEPALSIRATVEPQARFAHVDAAQVSGALIELIANAIESRAKSLIELRVVANALDGQLVISVRDDGKGMTAEQLEHACDPFFSARDSGRSQGLGLAKARQYARLHGGDLTLVSTPDHGTTATIAIPEWRSLSASRSRAAA